MKSTSGRGSNRKIELAGIKKLRELILELAVRGKLVPQDPSDEHVGSLRTIIGLSDHNRFEYCCSARNGAPMLSVHTLTVGRIGLVSDDIL